MRLGPISFPLYHGLLVGFLPKPLLSRRRSPRFADIEALEIDPPLEHHINRLDGSVSSCSSQQRKRRKERKEEKETLTVSDS
jgi:hypothetical protein